MDCGAGKVKQVSLKKTLYQVSLETELSSARMDEAFTSAGPTATPEVSFLPEGK